MAALSLHPTGITNVGNSCFLNAILQSLASVRSFHVFLLHSDDNNERKPLTSALRQSLLRLSMCQRDRPPPPLVPTSLLRLESLRRHFDRQQHDAQELFHEMMRVLGEEGLSEGVVSDESSMPRDLQHFSSEQFSSERPTSDPIPMTKGDSAPGLNGHSHASSLLSHRNSRTLQPMSGSSAPMCSRSFLSTVSLSPRPSTNEVVGSCFSTDNLQALTRSAEIDAAVHVGAAMSRLDVPLGASPTSLFPSDSESEPGLDTDDALLDAELHEILGEIRPPSGHVEGQMALAPPSTLQENPFSGMLESKTQCNECGFVYEEFLDMTLTIPAHAKCASLYCLVCGSGDFCLSFSWVLTLSQQRPSLWECLSFYTNPEPLSGVECDSCMKNDRAQRSTYTRSLRIGRAPNALLISFRRQLYTGTATTKTQRYVQFPLQLSLERFCSFNGGGLLYRLMAVVEHRGGSNGGHFTVFRRLWGDQPIVCGSDYLSALTPSRNPSRVPIAELLGMDVRLSVDSATEELYQDAHWVHISDETVRSVAEEEVLAAQAYMLVYERDAY